MAIHRLTPRELKKIEASKPERQKLHNDGGGLYLQVGKGGGAKSWIFRYSRKRFGKPGDANMGLGAYHTISIHEAREKARVFRQQILNGFDPMEKREAEHLARKMEASKRVTFAVCAMEWLDYKASDGDRKNTTDQRKNIIHRKLIPILGDLPISVIGPEHMHLALEKDWLAKPNIAKKVLAVAYKIFERARVRKLRTGDNPADLKGDLGGLLPRQTKKKSKPQPSLPFKDIGRFVAELQAYDKARPPPRGLYASEKWVPYGAALLEFIILTGVRKQEAAGARWEEINWAEETWLCPWERLKEGRWTQKPLKVHLSKRALALLKAMQDLQSKNEIQTPLVFASNSHSTAVHSYRGINRFVAKIFKKHLAKNNIVFPKWTIHGFRGTLSSWAHEYNFRNEAIEMCLDHKPLKNQIEQLYARDAEFWPERVRLMKEWADHCGRIDTQPAKVIPIGQHKTKTKGDPNARD
jgi:integrase